ncbi:MAG: hypothetical protein E6K18_04845, partial [Methanobacteriota archaeon]
MSESSPPAGGTLARVFGTASRLLRPAKKTWSLFKESRLAIVGLGIVLVFAFIAIFAPLISPYAIDFEAPTSDRFSVSAYPKALVANLTYNPPALGPTTPFQSDRQGGMWLINSVREGFVYMDFLQPSQPRNNTPFLAGNKSIVLDIRQDFGLVPAPSLNLTAVYYIVPGEGCAGTDPFSCPSYVRGPSENTGAIAFFTGREFIVA